MDNQFLSEPTARDIERRIDRVLRDIHVNGPPLRLEEVRELLRLDRCYYSVADPTLLCETVHRLKVAGKQILARPTLLLDVVRKRSLKALWLPDRKRILLDSDLPPLKYRWNEAHEVTHGLLPWHDTIMHGDPHHTLSPACELQLEAEANYGAGRLLFLGERFRQELTAKAICFDGIKLLARDYGNTITSTLWRVVENLDVAAVGIVSCHPCERLPDGASPVRYYIRSRRFARQFSQIEPCEVFHVLGHFLPSRPGPDWQFRSHDLRLERSGPRLPTRDVSQWT